MTKITIAYAWKQFHEKDDSGKIGNIHYRIVKYAWKDDDGTDKVRLVNQANKQVLDALETYSKTIMAEDVEKGPPPEWMDSFRLFDVYLDFYTSSDKNRPHVKVDYKTYPCCPIEIVDKGMEVVKMFRKELKSILVR